MSLDTLLVSKRTIALVEDDPDVTALVVALADAHTVQCFTNGAEAADALTGDAPTPDLVLLDLDLPGMHGLEVLKRLRMHPRTRHSPIVIFTATDTPPTEGYRLGANAWVQKSLQADELESTLHALLQFWTGVNKPAELTV